MSFTIYAIAWGLVFASTSAAAAIARERFGKAELRAKDALKVILVPGCVSLLSAGSLLMWAVIHMHWYEPPLGWALGLLISGFLQRTLAPAALRKLAPLTLVTLNVLLWLLPSGSQSLTRR